MNAADRIQRTEEILSSLKTVHSRKQWDKVISYARAVKTHMDFLIDVADELKIMAVEPEPPPPPPPALPLPLFPPKATQYRSTRKDKGTTRSPRCVAIRAIIEGMKAGDTVMLKLPDGYEDLRQYQNSVGGVASSLWGDGNYKTTQDKENNEVLLWRAK